MSDPSEQELRELVSLACKVLYAQGQEHFYLGHVSARAPGSEKVWVKPSGIGLGETEPEDVIAIDLDGKQLSEGRPAHKEDADPHRDLSRAPRRQLRGAHPSVLRRRLCRGRGRVQNGEPGRRLLRRMASATTAARRWW